MNSEKRKLTITNFLGEQIQVDTYYVKLSDFDDVIETINNEFVDIKEGSNDYSLLSAKRDLLNSFKNKDDVQKHGMVAEFFSHLFLRNLGYIQQSLFENLEEKSMKKGFDGLYEIDNDFWIMESKSAVTTKKHVVKIKEAINSIKKSLDVSSNNPWKNAVHHYICREKNNNSDSIFKKIKQLSIEYQEGIHHTIDEFNIIPVSTLFVDNKQSIDEMCYDLVKTLSSRNFKSVIVICIDNSLYNDFLKYLEV